MKWLILRRFTQFLVLALFILGNHFGIEILKGNLSSSVFVNSLHLSDPFATLQLLLAGFSLESASLIGACLVLVFYALSAPRAFCAWVCPINLLTDFAALLRQKLGISKSLLNLGKKTRYYVLMAVLLGSLAFSVPIFESVNYIAIFTRAILDLSLSALNLAVVIVIFEIFAGNRMICSHLCPLGAFWALCSKFALIRITYDSEICGDCDECKKVCPEVQVLNMVGKKSGKVGSECISCGRCADICENKALKFSILGVGK